MFSQRLSNLLDQEHNIDKSFASSPDTCVVVCACTIMKLYFTVMVICGQQASPSQRFEPRSFRLESSVKTSEIIQTECVEMTVTS